MFKKILVPVSSEFYSKDVLRRCIFLADTFKSTVHLIYVIEEKTLYQTSRRSDVHRTHYARTETEHDIMDKQMQAADDIVFEDAKMLFEQKKIPFDHKVIKGEFSVVVSSELEKEQYDIIVMGYERGCMINYRLLDNVDVPIWIETGGHHNSILAVCSNLAPNQKVPDLSRRLAQALDWDLHMLYVTDMEDTVEVDVNGERSERKPKRDLLFTGQTFVEDMGQKGIDVQTVQGSLEHETIKAAQSVEAGLVIIGREQKKRGKFGLPVRKLKQKMADRCKYSILFVK
ncbi:MAG: universal stress protein [Candidatus Thermoplasmatota archaeon]|nr:universal stress protein [Candidatus Thermoplasmatota archaeon]